MKRILHAALVVAMAGHLLPSVSAQDDPARRESRSYDLRPIAPSGQDDVRVAPRGDLIFVEGGRPSTAELRSSVFGDESAPRTVGRRESPGGLSFTRRSTVGPDHDDLAELLVQPLWHRDEEPSHRIASGRLLLTASPASHAAVGALVEEARRLRRAVRIECVLAPRALLDASSENWEEDAPAITPAAFEALLLDESTAVLEATTRSGDLAVAGDRESRAFVADIEVNQTGVIPVSNPVIESIDTGERLLVRPVALPRDEGIYVELAFDLASAHSTAFRVAEDWGDLNLPLVNESLFSLVTVLPQDQPRVLAWIGGEEDLVLLGRASFSPSETVRRGGETTEGFAWHLYSQDPLVFGDAFRTWWFPSRLGESPWISDMLVEYLREHAGSEVFDEGEAVLESAAGFLLLGGTPEVHRQISAFLDERRAQKTRLATVRLERLSLSRAAFVELRRFARGDGVLENGYREFLQQEGAVTERASFGLVVTDSSVHALRQARIRSLVVDTESVSGGTGFAIIERWDPVVQKCGHGTELRVRVGLSETGTTAHLQIHGAAAELAATNEQKTALPTLLETRGRSDSNVALPGGTVSHGRLQLPDQSVRYWNVDRQVELGRGVIIERTAKPGEGGEVVIATVGHVP